MEQKIEQTEEKEKEVKANRKKAKKKLAKIVGKAGSIGIGKNGVEVRLKKSDDKLQKRIPSKRSMVSM